MTTQDPELSAALGWPGGISDPVLDRTRLLQIVAALRLTSKQAPAPAPKAEGGCVVSKHTPGPWEWYGPNLLCGGERQSENILNSADDGRPYGHHAALIEHHWDGGVAKANARLIAAAPELLEALKALDVLFSPCVKDSTQADWIDKARAAIAKATGEQP